MSKTLDSLRHLKSIEHVLQLLLFFKIKNEPTIPQS